MSERRKLLIEIGTEELPPKALVRLSQAFADGLRQGLEALALTPGAITHYAAPRRLALLITGVPLAQPDREVVRRGPALIAAFDDDGCPTPAAVGFARSCGVEVDALEQLETQKGSWLVFRSVEQGRATVELLPELIEKALSDLPIPKRMRWGEGTVEFVRPVHWVVVLLGEEVVRARILGVEADRYTRGHRFHHPQPIYLGEPDAYLPILETEGQVLADHRARREAIRAQVLEQAERLDGQAVIDEALLDEVTALVEWPVALSGRFDANFLQVPAEALISSMQDHQKYFPVVDRQGRLQPCFIAVANIASREPEQIRAGNERVIRPRLADAAFFWNQDRKQPLAARAQGLRSMVFQERLGTLYDKQQRIAGLATDIASHIDADAGWTERAAQLCKCDLLTRMVFEFPELQGVMGRYYATYDGEPDEVAKAVEEHYLPRFAGDRLPETKTGLALALADRLDTLVGIFAIGQPPSGDKDPFALRRSALGVARILIEKQLELDLEQLLLAAATQLDKKLKADNVVGAVFDYIMERLRGYYLDSGVEADLFDAVLARRPTSPLDFHRRIEACRAFRKLPASHSLAAANKRIRNILRKSKQRIPDQFDGKALKQEAEIALARELDSLTQEVTPLLDTGRYGDALKQLARLKEPVDRFFEEVMVMADDKSLRVNRLALLQAMNRLFLRIADLSRLQS